LSDETKNVTILFKEKLIGANYCMKKLIINADDFGLHRDINTGIIIGYQTGCITSTSIMPTAGAFEHAVDLASAHSGLGIGVHLTLVGEKPVCDPSTVPSLVGEQGEFSPQYPQFLLKFISGQVRLREIRQEMEDQVRKVANMGINITHLDSHQHLHIMPGIIDIVIDIAKQFGIKALRIPAEPYFFAGGYPFTLPRMMGRSGLTTLARLARKKAKRYGLVTPDYFFGMLAGGNMTEKYLLTIIDQLPNGVSEIMIHPGSDDTILKEQFNWNYNWQAELAAVTSKNVLRRLAEMKIQSISFGELKNG